MRNSINETSISSNIHTLLVASVTNDNFSLTQKNILKIEAQLWALKSYVDCELSALASKIDFFSDSVKNTLSDLQDKEQEDSQIEVLKKNITLLQNEIKSKDTIIESLLETQKTLTKHLSNQIPKSFPSIENHSQQQLRQHQDYYQHHRQHQRQYSQDQAHLHLQQSPESEIAAQKHNKVHHFRETIPHTKINSIHYAVEICLMILLLVTCMNYLEFVVLSILVKIRTFKYRCLKIQENEELLLT